MRVTLDHNCLIHLESDGDIGKQIRALLANREHQCFVANVGASEMQRFGVRPDNYGAFEALLERIGVVDLPRLDPIGIWGVTFWDRCLYAGDNDAALLESIREILFSGTSPEMELQEQSPDAAERKALNRTCDALTMWCHISYKNDVFLTTDGNFFKQTKLPRLVEIGAGRICRPGEL